MTDQNFAYAVVFSSLVDTPAEDYLKLLHDHHERCMLMPASSEQDMAWRSTHQILVDMVHALLRDKVDISRWCVIAEYELPRERGRRPDAVILTDDRILVLEFKLSPSPGQPAIDQVRAYARDLGAYHSASHGRQIVPIVVTSGNAPRRESPELVLVSTGSNLAECIATALTRTVPVVGGIPIGTEKDQWETVTDPVGRASVWCAGTYAPLPSLVVAARAIFRDEPLPFIRHAHSAGIPEALATLVEVIRMAARDGTRHLALLAGVPGSGKTLTGLQLVFSDAVASLAGPAGATFLSGNGPLVSVLQHALKGHAIDGDDRAGKAFVRDVHGFLKTHGAGSRRVPHEHVLVFDEAQRAWDAAQVGAKRGVAVSKPEDFLRIGAKVPGWSVMVGLIGEGQEIHVGEEAGLGQWGDAVEKMEQEGTRWHVHCPPSARGYFRPTSLVDLEPTLNLTASLRSHLALDLHLWARNLLDGNIADARVAAIKCRETGFDLYVTDNVDDAVRYARARYQGQPDKRYGRLASHRARSLAGYGFDVEWMASRALSNRIGRWFNDEPSSEFSCTQLTETATEFQCQGLELDLPIVGWSNDLVPRPTTDSRTTVHWEARVGRSSALRDPQSVWRNKYRVLLTRGRDGMVVFAPPETPEVFHVLQDSGMEILEEWTLDGHV